MSVHVIYYKDGAKMMRPVLNREEYMQLRDSARQKTILRAVSEGNTKQKQHLVQMNYSCMPLANGALRGSKTASATVGMDIDLNEEEKACEWVNKDIRDSILNKKEELGLLMLEQSASKGYHLVFRRHPELSQEENLRWASELLGVKYDAGAKDITRVFFTTTAEELLFLDDEIFDTTEVCVSVPDGKSNTSEGSIDGRETVTDTVGINTHETGMSTAGYASDVAYNGISYSDIIAKYWELYNNGKTPVEGDRNVKTYELAMTLRCICDYSLERMLTVIPNYWGDGTEAVTEWRATIENALKEPRKGMPYRMKQVLQALHGDQLLKSVGGTATMPPSMPERLPRLVALLTRNVPDAYKPAVASAVFPALATHLHGVKFRYWDNVEHEATFMNILVGRQSVGKGCIKKPIELIMADVVERDKVSRAREAEWKRQNPSGKTKAKDPRPQDICIQMLIDNLTDAVFNQRIVDADHNGQRYVYTQVDEIEALRKVTSRGSTDEVLLLVRKAFDNALAGQERVGADSVSGIAPLRWNWNASTTPPNVRRFFAKGINDGTVSRLDVATIIVEDSDSAEAPVMGIYDEKFVMELKPYIDRLEAASGLIECPSAIKLSLEMRLENRDQAKLYDSEAYRILSYRANVIAWLKGMLLYIAQGYKWDKTIADFVRWSEQYNLWCKMLYFGQQLEDELRLESDIMNASGPRNLLDQLEDEFSREQYRLMRSHQGKPGEGESTLRTWMARGYIAYDEVSGMFHKTEKYLKR